MQRDGSGWRAGDRAQARLFQRYFLYLTELYQEQGTRREVRDGIVTHSARLDRAYTSLPQAIIRDLDIRRGVPGKLKAKMASDHIPIFVDIEPFRPYGGPKHIPKWVVKHPEFQRFLEAAIAEMSTEL
eukprot:5103958-Pyramimonas_sp.AAC.1